jgi:hypothetical protein
VATVFDPAIFDPSVFNAPVGPPVVIELSNDAIETALGQHLVTMPNVPPIAWPNANYDPKSLSAVPYLEFVHAPVGRVDEVISGGYERQIGLALITVVVERGKFTGQANMIAESVAKRFPKALRLSLLTGGDIVINAPSEIVQGFADGVYWRVPVRVNYVTEG